MDIVYAEAGTGVTTDVSTIVSAITNQASSIITDGISMISGVAPYIVAMIGVGVVLSIGLKYIRKMRGV